MYHPIQFKTTTLPIKYSTGRSPLRRGFFLISLALTCFVLPPPAQAQLPNIFAADNPSGSLNSDGANSQSQPVSTSQPTPTPSPTSNGLLTGLYAYYKLDEASGAGALDAGLGARNLIQSNGGGPIGSVPGIINAARSFPGDTMFIRNTSTSDFSPGSNHFFVSFWAKAGSLGQREMEMVSKFTSQVGNREWIVFLDLSTRKAVFFASSDGATVSSVSSSIAFANTTTWYFIVAGWDGTNVKISINGGPYVTASFPGPIFKGSALFTIGSENGSLPWIGQIDEMAIWIGRNDLTISDVQQLYNNGAGLPFSSFH
ncbi:MAG TPA: LamG-like jellyroll fold domain-containing protein [Nitrososphaera sp.]|nr:LamG-like jellyroll fold domain-containing protein [Nitrososphaera sp.]